MLLSTFHDPGGVLNQAGADLLLARVAGSVVWQPRPGAGSVPGRVHRVPGRDRVAVGPRRPKPIQSTPEAHAGPAPTPAEAVLAPAVGPRSDAKASRLPHKPPPVGAPAPTNPQ